MNPRPWNRKTKRLKDVVRRLSENADRLAENEQRLGDLTQRIDSCDEGSSEMLRLRQELLAIRAERERVQSEQWRLREKGRILTLAVQHLRRRDVDRRLKQKLQHVEDIRRRLDDLMRQIDAEIELIEAGRGSRTKEGHLMAEWDRLDAERTLLLAQSRFLLAQFGWLLRQEGHDVPPMGPARPRPKLSLDPYQQRWLSTFRRLGEE